MTLVINKLSIISVLVWCIFISWVYQLMIQKVKTFRALNQSFCFLCIYIYKKKQQEIIKSMHNVAGIHFTVFCPKAQREMLRKSMLR